MARTQRLLTRVRHLSSLERDLSLFCLGFALLRAWASLGRPPVRYPDTETYLHLNFLGQGVGRLWTVPLMFKALPSDAARTLGLLLIGIACWSALAFAVAHNLRHPIFARAGAIAILVLGLCLQIVQWDQILLSESLSLSLTALLVACLLWVRLDATPWRLAALLVVLMLWIFNRQLQAAIFIPIAVIAIAWILLRRRTRRFVIVAAAVALLAAWGGYASSNSSVAGNRSLAHDLLVLRLFQSQEAEEYFAARGMPQMAALKEEAAKHTDLGSFDPVLQDPGWQKWVDKHWQRTYAGWLLRHPIDSIRVPLTDVPNELSGISNYSSVRPALPGPVQDLIWDRVPGGGDVPFLVALTLVLGLASLRAGRLGSLDALGAILVAVATLWYYVGWHGGVSELPRILVPVASLLRISLIILALAALDRLAVIRRATRLEVADPRGVCDRPGIRLIAGRNGGGARGSLPTRKTILGLVLGASLVLGVTYVLVLVVTATSGKQPVTLTSPPKTLPPMAALAARRVREDQAGPGYWLTNRTGSPRYVAPAQEMNTYLTSILVDQLAPIARKLGVADVVARAKRELAAQIEGNGLVRYHGLPNAPAIATLGCVITPDADDTALVWRIAGPGASDPRLQRMLGILRRYRDGRGLYRTWLAPPNRYQCINPGRDPDPADIAIQMHVYLMLREFDRPAARALCRAMLRWDGKDEVWVYYAKTALVPYLRSAELEQLGCPTPLPTARLARPVAGQERWSKVARLLVETTRSRPTASARQAIRHLLAQLGADDFALLRKAPPLLYHNDPSASVKAFYWSEDVGYALWLRLYEAVNLGTR
jgi:hypothetical protein